MLVGLVEQVLTIVLVSIVLSYVLLNAHINLIKAYRLLVGGLMSSGKSFVSYLSPLRLYEVYRCCS